MKYGGVRNLVWLLAAGVLLVLGAMFFTRSGVAVAQDCNENSIMFCGTGSASQFIAKVRANDDGHGHHDLQAVFAHFGLGPALFNSFVTSARMGTAFSDGRIVVDGQTVATNAKSIGRLQSFQGANPFSMNIGGVTYWGNGNARAFASGSIPVMVLFNSRGEMLFAVLTSCGNPTFGNNVVPSFRCNALHKTPVAGRANTFNFTTDASAATNATITKLTYDFGDGTTRVVTSNFGAPVQHTYGRPGTFTARVSVTVSLPGSHSATVTAVNCATTITILPPPKPPTLTPNFSCTSLAAELTDRANQTFRFTATASMSSGVVLNSGDFDFGDSATALNVPASGATVTTTHSFGVAGSFTTTATLHFTTGTTQQTATCSVSTASPVQPTPPPVQPPAPPSPPPPTVLVNTGAGDLFGIFGVTTVLGAVAHRLWLLRRAVRPLD